MSAIPPDDIPPVLSSSSSMAAPQETGEATPPGRSALECLNLAAEPSFYLLVLNEEGVIERYRYDTDAQLQTRLRELIDVRDVQVFPFLGHPLAISKAPLRYLVTPFGNLPLFDTELRALELEEDGYVGKRYMTQVIPDTDGVVVEDEPDEDDEEIPAEEEEDEGDFFEEDTR